MDRTVSNKTQIDRSSYPGSRGDGIARSALAYRGVPYRFGGRSPQSGFDCSGLVQAVCAKWGIYLPRVARAQYSRGVTVAPDQLASGDLVFFRNTYRSGLSHVGIYIGDGKFVHAAGQRKGVRVSSLSDRYYRAHWAGARRLDLSRLPADVHDVPVTAQEVTIDTTETGDNGEPVSSFAPRPFSRVELTDRSEDPFAGEGRTLLHNAAPRAR